MKLATIFLMLFSISAFATEVTTNGGLDLVKLACKDPGAVHNQLPPSGIKIACKVKWCEWATAPQSGTYNTPTEIRTVCGALMTNKPGIHVPKWCWDTAVPGTPSQYSCPGFAEICYKYNSSYSVTCDVVMAMTTIEAFCNAKLSEDISGDPGVVTEKPSGKVINLCDIGTPTPTPTGPGQEPGQTPARPRQR